MALPSRDISPWGYDPHCHMRKDNVRVTHVQVLGSARLRARDGSTQQIHLGFKVHHCGPCVSQSTVTVLQLKTHEKSLLFWIQLLRCYFSNLNVKFWSFLSFWNVTCSRSDCVLPMGCDSPCCPTPTHLLYQEMRAMKSYLPHITFKISTCLVKHQRAVHCRTRVKTFLPAHSARRWSHPTTAPLCRATSWLHAGESMAGMLPNAKVQRLLQSSAGTFPAATQHSGYATLHINKEMESAHAKLASSRIPEITTPLLEKGAGKPFLRGHNI